MSVEIERKFKVKDTFRPTDAGMSITQGYLLREPKRTVRIRIAGIQGFLTIKGETHGAARLEYEYEIPAEEARELLALCPPPLVEKTRYVEVFAGKRWEVDVFHGENGGLVIAEIELESEDEAFALPAWVGVEVTGETRYYNAALIAYPYRLWTAEERGE